MSGVVELSMCDCAGYACEDELNTCRFIANYVDTRSGICFTVASERNQPKESDHDNESIPRTKDAG